MPTKIITTQITTPKANSVKMKSTKAKEKNFEDATKRKAPSTFQLDENTDAKRKKIGDLYDTIDGPMADPRPLGNLEELPQHRLIEEYNTIHQHNLHLRRMSVIERAEIIRLRNKVTSLEQRVAYLEHQVRRLLNRQSKCRCGQMQL